MSYLDRFRNKMNIYGNSLKQELTNNSRKLLEEVFNDDPTHESVFMWKLGFNNRDDYKNCEPINIRFYNKKYTVSNGMTIEFQTTMKNPIIVGDIIYNPIEEIFLLCIESFIIANTHYKGKFSYCNWILKWQDKLGNILEYPCYDSNSTQYNSGETANKQFTIGTSQHAIMLPCDENTLKLDSPKRFYLDKNIENPTSYILTQSDTTSYNFSKKGIIRITLLECQNDDEKDRPDLGICDYIEPKQKIEIENKKYSKIDFKTNIIKSGGSSQIFYGKFFDGGIESNLVECIWEIIYENKEKLNIEKNNNYIKISIDDDSLVDDEIKLCLKDSNSQYEPSYIILKIGRLF